MGHDADRDSLNLAESYIADIMRREAEIAATPDPVARSRSRARSLAVLGVVLIAVCAIDAVILIRMASPFSPVDQVTSARYVMYFTSRAVESYRASRRELPRDLGAVGMAGNGITYVPAGEAYLLQMRGPDGPIEFRSDADSGPFTAVWDQVGASREP